MGVLVKEFEFESFGVDMLAGGILGKSKANVVYSLTGVNLRFIFGGALETGDSCEDELCESELFDLDLRGQMR